ncbi:MAG: LysR family transcriptional regulator [Clostridia bacterium]|nr:LysR family transcriptional regulator [Clostridia bacterium]
MNILHMKYAVEVARMGSINRAAEALYIAQPNLSRCIRELESDLGVELFKRSTKGMVVTPEGETFIRYAKQVLNQIDEIEKLYKGENLKKQRFSISVPRASYIADAFAQFTRCIGDDPMEIYYMETNTQKAIKNLLSADYRLGVIRYAKEDDAYFQRMLEERGIVGELVTDFTYVLIMRRDSAMAGKEELYHSDLAPMIEISHGDPFVPAILSRETDRKPVPEEPQRSILLFERGSQFDLLCENPQTYMWVSPIPQKLLERYNLVQRSCMDVKRVYRDVLIWRKDYELTALDREFIAELMAAKQRMVRQLP